MGVTFPVGVFRAIPEARPEPSIVEQLIESSSGTDTGADETPIAEAGRIRVKTRAIETRVNKSIFLFFIAAPPFHSFIFILILRQSLSESSAERSDRLLFFSLQERRDCLGYAWQSLQVSKTL